MEPPFEFIRRIPPKLRWSLVIFAIAVIEGTVELLLPSTAGGIRTVLEAMPTSTLLAVAIGALLPYLWEERSRWVGVARHWWRQIAKPWLNEPRADRDVDWQGAAVRVEAAQAQPKPPYLGIGLAGRVQALGRIREAIEKVADDFYSLRRPVFEGIHTEWANLGPTRYAEQVRVLIDRLQRVHDEMEMLLKKIDYPELKAMASAWHVPHEPIQHINIWLEAVDDSLPSSQVPTYKLAWRLYMEAMKNIERWIDQMRTQVAAQQAKYEAADMQ